MSRSLESRALAALALWAGLATVVLLVQASLPLAPSAAPGTVGTRITTDPSNHATPDIYGNIVVWEDKRNGNWDIYMKDLATGQEAAVSTAPEKEYDPRIYGNIVVWVKWQEAVPGIGVGRYRLYMKDLSTGQSSLVGTRWGTDHAIHAGKIAWVRAAIGVFDPYVTYAVHIKDLSTGQESVLVSHTVLAETEGNPFGGLAIYGNVLLWRDSRGAKTEIRMIDLSTGVQSLVSDNVSGAGPAIYEKLVVWECRVSGAYRLCMKDLATGAESVLQGTAESYSADSIAIYGTRLVWMQDTKEYFYLRDLASGAEYRLDVEAIMFSPIAMHGEVVVWWGFPPGSLSPDIYMLDLSQPLSTPTPTPTSTSTRTPTPTAQAPPQIPHTLEGRAACTTCHAVGGQGVGAPGGTGLPTNHAGRTDATCTNCHQAAAEFSPTPTPTLAPGVTPAATSTPGPGTPTATPTPTLAPGVAPTSTPTPGGLSHVVYIPFAAKGLPG